MNVLDHLKTKTVPEIKEYYINNTIPAASAMMHVTGDFNLSTLIRNSNFFGYEKVFYVGGKKHYDRRGTVGTHNYIDVTFIKTEEEFVKTIKDQGYTLISIENNVNYECSDLFQFMDNVNVKDIKPIFIFGEEQKGLSDYILDNSEHILTISGKGTVRSLNVGTASGIVLGYYSKFF
jgi:tRNA G18 (ribose-2'-O)-methylase SpoU